MRYSTYKKAVKNHRDLAFDLIRENAHGGIANQYHANALEHAIEGIITIATRDPDLSNREFKTLLRYKHLIFKWNLYDQWREA